MCLNKKYEKKSGNYLKNKLDYWKYVEPSFQDRLVCVMKLKIGLRCEKRRLERKSRKEKLNGQKKDEDKENKSSKRNILNYFKHF